MDNNENTPENIALESWSKAVEHAERAEELREDLIKLTNHVQKSINKEKALAGFWLALGGFAEDEAAHRQLKIPFIKEN